jgi:hypothetical protein
MTKTLWTADQLREAIDVAEYELQRGPSENERLSLQAEIEFYVLADAERRLANRTTIELEDDAIDVARPVSVRRLRKPRLADQDANPFPPEAHFALAMAHDGPRWWLARPTNINHPLYPRDL